ncbi:MAG TPA: adenosylcobinamide-GDP ribazoletransferase, partial [Candidatus Binatia bacterium]|nr:adenosylcobinamide-GDP ribazoletransferase [Candidatus Binatia bacterium]
MAIARAFKILTLSENVEQFDAGPAGIGIFCLPLMGVVLGVILVGMNLALEPYLASEVLAVLLLTIWIVATAGRHLSGLQQTVATWGRTNTAVDSSDRGAVQGVLAVLIVVLFKSHCLEVIGESRGSSVLLTPLLARWSLLLFLFGSTPLGDDVSARIVGQIRSWHLIAATVASLGLALFFASNHALWVALSLSLLALRARSYLHRRNGG